MQKTPLFRNAANSQKGMTLVEIMVVIAILGTLMAVVAFSVVGKLDDANCQASVLAMRNADQGLQAYAAKHKGKFPSTSDGLAAAAKYFGSGEVPKDAWGNEFQYAYPPAQGGSPYELISLGKDGAEGGDGWDSDIKSWELDNACADE